CTTVDAQGQTGNTEDGQAGGIFETRIEQPGPAVPPPDARTLARSVIAGLRVPVPLVEFDSSQPIAVKVPVGVVLTSQTSVTAADECRGLARSADAYLATVEFGMCEPLGGDAFVKRNPESAMTCDATERSGARGTS